MWADGGAAGGVAGAAAALGAGASLAADDLLPLYALALVDASGAPPDGGDGAADDGDDRGGGLRHCEAHALFVESFLPEHAVNGEQGYALVLFRSAAAAVCEEAAKRHAAFFEERGAEAARDRAPPPATPAVVERVVSARLPDVLGIQAPDDEPDGGAQ